MSLQMSTTGVHQALLQFPLTSGPTCSAKISLDLGPLLHLVDQITLCVFPHTTEQDSQPIAILISKQVIPYQTRGDTCCPGVSTPKIQSLADSSMTNHIIWRTSIVSTISTLAQTTVSTSPRSTHISTDGRLQLSHKDTSRTQHHKRWKTCTTLMTAGLANLRRHNSQS
jgi:hypothetical protein